jgi:DNA-binding HxlR family transcriptional regulator
MSTLITRASSINRALDEVGDKWCLLIIQEVFWGINSFSEMMAAMGVSRSVLSNRLRWLQARDCLRKESDGSSRHARYHLTPKSLELYDSALMAITWERHFYSTPELDKVTLVHRLCGQTFTPEMRCNNCAREIRLADVGYQPGPGATADERPMKTRRRSSVPLPDTGPGHRLYKNLVNLAGDRWTANVIALSFHGLTRFDEFHRELPLATNILTDRLKRLVQLGVFIKTAYQHGPLRYDYRLSDKGEALFPWFLGLLQWGDKWCDTDNRGKPMLLSHRCCGQALQAAVCCNACDRSLRAYDVEYPAPGAMGA